MKAKKTMVHIVVDGDEDNTEAAELVSRSALSKSNQITGNYLDVRSQLERFNMQSEVKSVQLREYRMEALERMRKNLTFLIICGLVVSLLLGSCVISLYLMPPKSMTCNGTTSVSTSSTSLTRSTYRIRSYVQARYREPCHELESNDTINGNYSENYKINVSINEKIISCYYNTPDGGENELLPSDLNPHLCTHINIAFATIQHKKIYLSDHQIEAIEEIVKLKKKNPKLKILLSIGGAGLNNGFSEMVVDHASRKEFIKSIKEVLKNYALDGVDLDWEFPAVDNCMEYGVTNRERQHFSQLLREIRAEYVREKKDYILSVAVASPKPIVDASYDVDQINLYADYVNLMTYDYHSYTTTTPFTGLNSPLFPEVNDKFYFATLNINYTVHMYIEKGLDRDKIVVGIPTYGHTFKLVTPFNTNLGSPVKGYGSLGSLGFVDYSDICKFIEEYGHNVSIIDDENAKVPYLYKDLEWVSYDTPQSVMEKANFIKEYNLRGAMIYSLNSDDYKGICTVSGTQKFPLSLSVKNTLISNNKTQNDIEVY